ncbi:MAG: cupin domain-containing protein [Candidatus Omnitrophica bacterium]|nr:cupin domain-containing protein [Candidatus Omnitrophota bacterium]
MKHKKVSRPWGYYTTINTGTGFKVKLVEVLPGKRLSLQRHAHRSEHWVVVNGTAKITNGRNILFLDENESTYIPKMTIHRLENPEKKRRLRIVEVQCGNYTGEDDIERIDDDHGRVPA